MNNLNSLTPHELYYIPSWIVVSFGDNSRTGIPAHMK